MLLAKTFELLTQVNHELERGVSSRLLDECTIEGHWASVCDLDWECSAYWLLMARIAEATLLCAGNHADNCEYRAAGDLLVNPREIGIHDVHGSWHITKNRHGRLSDQFMKDGSDRRMWMRDFGALNHLEVTKPPLLPHMAQVLRGSRRISEEYLERFQKMQCRIADTLAFTAAWRLKDSADLWRRMETCSAAEREFALSNLCRFDTGVFQQIGRDLRQAMLRSDHRSPLLCGRFSGVTGVPHDRPAAARVASAQFGSSP
jgi:hypothetical protein